MNYNNSNNNEEKKIFLILFLTFVCTFNIHRNYIFKKSIKYFMFFKLSKLS